MSSTFTNNVPDQQSPLHRHRNPRELTSLPEILSCLSEFQSEETELSENLAALLKQQAPVVSALERIQKLSSPLDEILIDARQLSLNVSTTAKTANRVASSVRSLDEEVGRVREASDHVAQVMELKTSLSELHASIESRDWESAARYCANAMSIPTEITKGGFAEAAVPTAEMHLPPLQTLQSARETLLVTFQQNFEDASKARDAAATSRFFKLFPAIGWEQEGLNAYSNFVVDLVRERAPTTLKTSSPLYYIATLTSLFENIALIIDQHEPVVTKYYGRGKMNTVVGQLLEEVDKVSKKLMSGWAEDRAIQRKLQDAANLTAARKSRLPDDNLGDPREIDKVLSELASLVGRWHMFKRFLLDALKDEGNPSTAEDLLSHSQAPSLFEDMVTNYYLPLETWYTQIIIDKAHKLSTLDSTQTPVVTTTPDDVFYILKAVVTRLLTTGSISGVSRTMQQLRDIIERDYINAIRKKLDDVYKTSSATSGVRAEKVDRENRLNFIILLNDLDLSTSHLERLTRDLTESPLISQHFLDSEEEEVKKYISSLADLRTRFASSLRAGIEQLFNQLIRPRLRNIIPEVYKDVNYVLADDGHGIAAYPGHPRKRFIRAWDTLFEGYKDHLSENNFRLFIGLAVDVILKPWEKQVVSLKYSEYGALAFEQDLRGMTAHLIAQTTFGDIKDKFARLRQISDLLNLGNDEDVDEYYNTSGERWKIGPHEARAIAALRV